MLQVPAGRPSFYRLTPIKSARRSAPRQDEAKVELKKGRNKKRNRVNATSSYKKWAYKARQVGNHKSKGKKLPSHPE